MKITIIDNIDQIPAAQWNAIAGVDYPFTRHEFLAALEHHQSVGPKFGWYPRYVVAHENEQLISAVPMYLKDNSYGELVFDWSWADAYERSGLQYYPKLVIGIPYTPAPGQRILCAANDDDNKIKNALIQTIQSYCKDKQYSSVHWLFTDDATTQLLAEQSLLKRKGVQYHWFNNQYEDFDDFLATFSSKKRKNVKRERRRVVEQDITIKVFHGNELEDHLWEKVHHFYQITFLEKHGHPTFSQDFFKEIGQTMGEQLVLLFAYHNENIVACSICYRSDDTLYGRHWGSDRIFDNLHFELCYYQGIEYCIKHGLKSFEPGAQGEYKISRGFVPTKTWSAHWLSHPEFYSIVERFLKQESSGMEEVIEDLNKHVPYKTKT